MIQPHSHTCARCGFVWKCILVPKPKQKVCQVDMAVKVNKTGPDCLLCYHLVMAIRVATLREFKAWTFTQAVGQRWEEEATD